MRDFNELMYSDRLNTPDSLTLKQRKMYSDMVTVFKSLHGLSNCSASDLGLSLTSSRSDDESIRLEQQRATSRAYAA